MANYLSIRRTAIAPAFHYWYIIAMSAEIPMDWERLLGNPPDIYHLGIGRREGLRQRFYLADLWSINVYDYAAKVVLNGHAFAIRPGTVALIPPATERVFDWYKPVSQRTCHFVLPAWDGRHPSGAVIFDIGGSFLDYVRQFDKAVAYFPTEQYRSRAMVWELLWRLSEALDVNRADRRPGLHPGLRAAVAHIEHHLHDITSVREIASRTGISHGHLIRLFKARFGTTIAGYILRRRVQLAKHLLARSDCGVKEIACLVGIPDLHHFNKVIKRATGLAPRAYRRRAMQ